MQRPPLLAGNSAMMDSSRSGPSLDRPTVPPEDSWIRNTSKYIDHGVHNSRTSAGDLRRTGADAYAQEKTTFFPSTPYDYAPAGYTSSSSSTYFNTPTGVDHTLYVDALYNRSTEMTAGLLPYSARESAFTSRSLPAESASEVMGKSKRPVLMGPPPADATPYGISPNAGPNPSFGLGVGKYGNEIPSPLDAEIQHTILEMQQELAYIDTLSVAADLRHSKRLLKERCAKLEGTVDPDWVEVDINKPIKVTKRVLIPSFRHPNFNYVGKILGTKGQTLQNICKKFKCFISVMGAGSTKDRTKEVELLNSNDPRFAHYASPLHVRIDTVAPAHIAHTRMAACLTVFHKLLIPGGNGAEIEGITIPERSNAQNKNDIKDEYEYEGDHDFKYEDEAEELQRKIGFMVKNTQNGASYSNSFTSNSGDAKVGGPIKTPARGASTPATRGGRGGGFVPKARVLAAKGKAPY
ncbi:KH domain-containing, RNA-binding, signal transduction-associated protein 2 [Ditylenchus destructor]|nr:KH domain-containing, RNA-binding, signal transduction-associated protein 2 [Ditylenchus destructor]